MRVTRRSVSARSASADSAPNRLSRSEAVIAMVLAGLFVLAMLTAVVWDVATYEIPDTLSVALVLGAVAGLVLADGGPARLPGHGLLAFVLFAIGAVLFAARQWGGGDVKFMAATGLWLEWGDLPAYAVAVALVGGVLAVAILLLRRLPMPARWHKVPWLARLRRPDQGLPYGVALGVGGLMTLAPALRAAAGGAGALPFPV